MNDPESRSLWRAAIVLLTVSTLRWAGGYLGERQSVAIDGSDGSTVLPELVASTEEVARESDRRSRALGPGERIDPNRADDIDLDRLPGVGPSTAAAIISARDSGAVFRRPDDLTLVRGIGPALVDKMSQFLDFREPPVSPRTERRRGPRAPPVAPRQASSDLNPSTAPVDINRATLADLERLPGVGPALATRIIEARAERPFSTLNDLVRVSGIGPATIARLQGFAVVGRSR